MTPAQLDRYARQVRLPQIGANGQQRLLDARVLVIGLGGLGSPAAMYLAAAGVGTLVLSDFDRVEESNLQRQIAHRQQDIGEPKAASAARTLTAINPGCTAMIRDWELDGSELAAEVALADLVVDCCDNFETRFALNAACVAAGTPLVSGAAIRLEGQVMTYLPGAGPCYRCLYPQDLANQPTCAMEGVLAPLVGVIGSMQALQAVQVLVGNTEALPGRLLLFDAAHMIWQTVTVGRNPDCPVCGG